MKSKIQAQPNMSYNLFEEVFLEVLEEHAPVKKKTVRHNNKPYMTKALRKAIMRRSALRNKFLKVKTDEAFALFKKQKNYTNKILKKERNKQGLCGPTLDYNGWEDSWRADDWLKIDWR